MRTMLEARSANAARAVTRGAKRWHVVPSLYVLLAKDHRREREREMALEEGEGEAHHAPANAPA